MSSKLLVSWFVSIHEGNEGSINQKVTTKVLKGTELRLVGGGKTNEHPPQMAMKHQHVLICFGVDITYGQTHVSSTSCRV